jgi:hypothetical protein
MAIFRHHQRDGAQVITVYNHLQELGNFQPGDWIPQGARVGTVESQCEHHFLHFAVAYGATWETDLKVHPDVPRNAGPAWIRQRYLSPLPYLQGHTELAMELPNKRFDEE